MNEPKTATEVVREGLPAALAKRQAERKLEAEIAQGKFDDGKPLTVYEALQNVARTANVLLFRFNSGESVSSLKRYFNAVEKSLEALEAAEIRPVEALRKSEDEER